MCRTYNGSDINFPEIYQANLRAAIAGENLPHPDFRSAIQKDGRGNIVPVTIILPKLAMMAAGEIGEKDVDSFMDILSEMIDEAYQMLLERYDIIKSQSPRSARFMYGNMTMFGYDGKTIESAVKHGTLALGQIGLAETLQILIGKNQRTEEGLELAKRIEALFRDKCAKFKQRDKMNVAVYMTPAESLCYTAMKRFKKEYGVIPNVSEKSYFTNSVHLPVWEEISPFEKIDIEAKLDGYSSAGAILYNDFDSQFANNLEAMQQIIAYAMDHDVPYYAINVPTKDGIVRITGYLVKIETMNAGKRQEQSDRCKLDRYI